MNAAHGLDRADNDTVVVMGRDWIISSRISTGSVESIVQVLGIVWLGIRSGHDHYERSIRTPGPKCGIHPQIYPHPRMDSEPALLNPSFNYVLSRSYLSVFYGIKYNE